MGFSTLTCNTCIYRKMLPHPNTKEIMLVCTRFPPRQHSFMTNNGPAFMTAYPAINKETLACGEWDDGKDINFDDDDEPLPGEIKD